MKAPMRYFLAVLLAFVSLAARAEDYEYKVYDTAWYPSGQAACAAYAVQYAAANPTWNAVYRAHSETQCGLTVTYKDGGGLVAQPAFPMDRRPLQPGDCTLTLSKSKVTNFTVCYARGGGALTDCATAPGHPITGQSVCMDGCSWGTGDPVTAFKSETVTSTGLYRLSVDMRMAGLGQTCSGAPDATQTPFSPQATTPPCVGSLGEVNGKPFCAGTAQNPTANDKPSGLSLPPESGNPRAGDKPDTGEGSGSGGSGRTPSSGDGGAGGGPATAAGTGSTGPVTGGTVTKPGEGKEQAACGAPGQPQCKIDESGTPTDASGKFTAATTKLDAAMDAHKGIIEGIKDRTGESWSMTFELPTGCTSLPMWEGVVIDMCEYQPVIHDLMSMVWLGTTIWAMIAIMARNMAQGG